MWSREISPLVCSPCILYQLSVIKLSIQHGFILGQPELFIKCLGKKEFFSKYTVKTARGFPLPWNNCSRYTTVPNRSCSLYIFCFLVNTVLTAMRNIWKAESCNRRCYPKYFCVYGAHYWHLFRVSWQAWRRISYQEKCFYSKKSVYAPQSEPGSTY